MMMSSKRRESSGVSVILATGCSLVYTRVSALNLFVSYFLQKVLDVKCNKKTCRLKISAVDDQ